MWRMHIAQHEYLKMFSSNKYHKEIQEIINVSMRNQLSWFDKYRQFQNIFHSGWSRWKMTTLEKVRQLMSTDAGADADADVIEGGGGQEEASRCSKLQSIIFGSLQTFFKCQVIEIGTILLFLIHTHCVCAGEGCRPFPTSLHHLPRHHHRRLLLWVQNVIILIHWWFPLDKDNP